jgi:hypothetical protein
VPAIGRGLVVGGRGHGADATDALALGGPKSAGGLAGRP